MAERLGIEPSKPVRVLQFSKLLHYRPAHAPKIGGQGGVRTHDLRIKSPLFYLLNYLSRIFIRISPRWLNPEELHTPQKRSFQ